MSHMMNAPIILLKEGTDSSQGKAQIISNINACQMVVDIVSTTLGPRGMDKLIHGENGVTITNDGATVMSLLNVIHPAACILVDISKAQDDEVGDGTTSVVILAGELLKEAKMFIEEALSPQIIIRGYRKACNLALKKLEELQIDLSGKSTLEKRELLLRCAETTLNSKLVSTNKEFFAKMAVDAVCTLDEDLDKDMIGIKKVTGGSCLDSLIVKGVAFKKTFSYAGFEQQPKKFKNPKILLLNLELELKAEKENAEIRLENPDDYQSIVDAEWSIIYEKLDTIVSKSDAQVVLSRLPIGDLATQYFADRNIFCAGRVEESDMRRTARATGASIQSTVNGLTPAVLGACKEFEEIQIGSERFNLFKDCPTGKSATLILRGGAQQFLEEADRSLNDAIMIVRRAMKTNSVLGGGGAIEMELSRYLREQSRLISGKEQLVVNSFARALEVIPKALARNSGFDSTDLLNILRQKHNQGNGNSLVLGSRIYFGGFSLLSYFLFHEFRWFGVDCNVGGLVDCFKEGIWEPTIVKKNILSSATEAASVILSIDETIKSPASDLSGPPAAQRMAGGRPGMRGRGMRR
ncbi:T-complex protein 1 eta subunit [Cardiosporidium cionae]|uniref:T-complex protein 1 subunit eta n=1 Tax=Cardiosporidium cionae TaxID=476202 RepID=A0ABQ7J9Z1_9APIC|nr:T-complex protein 1 eta subunit [Cardiosporidium cionae]|eukprot:KAF8820758.1 T-complex protein 1 eta subunit [Cardiosporidium cionae]